MRKYRYDRGEHRVKHCWNRPDAGFVPSHKGPVGKCSCKITDEVAQALLDDAIPDTFEGLEGLEVDHSQVHPKKFFNVYEGVPYEAAVTSPGESYHGYPWRKSMPMRILRALAVRAEKQGHIKVFKAWVKEYAPEMRW